MAGSLRMPLDATNSTCAVKAPAWLACWLAGWLAVMVGWRAGWLARRLYPGAERILENPVNSQRIPSNS